VLSPPPALAVSVDVTAVPDEPAGAGRYTVDLVGALAGRADLRLTLVARSHDAGRWTRMAPAALVRAAAPRPRPLRLAWEQVGLPRLLAGAGVAVHHGPHYTMPERAHLPRVVTVHDLTFFDHPEWHERAKVPFFRRAIRVAAARADALVCVSQATADRLQALLSPMAAVFVVPHGVDHGRFTPEEETIGADRARLELIGLRQPYVAFVGNPQPRKGVDVLVRAFDRMCDSVDGLVLVLAGAHGWGEARIAAELSAMRHPDRVVRPGYLPDATVAALLRRAAAVAYPSLAEGFGLPVLEALACGAPVVTTTGTPMSSLAGEAALLVPPGDDVALAEALRHLVTGPDPERRRRGIALAAGYTWEASAAAHVEVYRRAAEGGGQRPR